MTANGGMSTQTPARRTAPMRINAHKRVTMTAALSSGSHSSVPCGRITPSSFHSESEFESDDGLLRSASRRSKRNRPVDPSKDLVVIRPNDDISTLLGITGTDLDEFIEVCNEGAEWRPATAGVSAPSSNVHTPLVQSISNSSLAASVKDTSRRGKKLPPRVSTGTSLSQAEVHGRLMESRTYFDYDADSEDELFLDEMAEDMHCSSSARSSKKKAVKAISRASVDPVTPEQLETIFNVLERELEVARVFHKQMDTVKLQYKSMLNAMAETKEMLTVLASDEVSARNNKSKVNGKKKRTRKSAPPQKAASSSCPYSNAIISEALEICDQHLLTARTALEEVGAAGTVSAEGTTGGAATTVDLESSAPGPGPTPRRRGRPPLHGRARSGSDVNTIGSELAGPSANKNKNKAGSREEDDPEYNLPPFYTTEELRELVPWAVAEGIIKDVLPDLFSKQLKHSSSSHKEGDTVNTCPILASEVSELTSRAADSLLVLSPPYRVYEHWLSRRSPRRTSFLRGFHVFLMENWKASHALGTAVIPCSRDEVRDRLIESRRQLLRLRIDLDRARLIMDLVRKREKMKKMLFRNASESFDEVFSLQEFSEAEDKPVASKKRKKGSGGGGKPSTELLKFFQAFSSDEESSSEQSDESSAVSSEEEEEVRSVPKRPRAGAAGSGGDNLAHLSVRLAASVPENSRSHSKRLKTQQVTEPVLARLPQPAKTPTRALLSGAVVSTSHSKAHSASKAATPCSLQNAAMVKHPSSSSLSSAGSSPRVHDIPSAAERRAARVTRNAVVTSDRVNSRHSTASAPPPQARSLRKKVVVSPVPKNSGAAYAGKLRANGLKRQQENTVAVNVSPGSVSVTRSSRSKSLRNRSREKR